jgi:hypothetical protein
MKHIHLADRRAIGFVKLPETLFFLGLLLLVGCQEPPLHTLPEQLFGEWHTDEARYNGRSMKFEGERVTFGLGGVASDRREGIEAVRVTTTPDGAEYRIALRTDDGSADSLQLKFTGKNGGELRLASQPNVVWTHGKFPIRPPARPAPLQPANEYTYVGSDHKTIYKIDCLRPNTCRSY